MTYIKENIMITLQKLYSPSRNPREGNKLPALLLKKPLCMDRQHTTYSLKGHGF